MTKNWEILQQELAFHGVRLVDQNVCDIISDGKVVRKPIPSAIKALKSQIDDNKELFIDLWQEAVNVLEYTGKHVYEQKMVDLFVYSVKELTRFAECFPDMRKSHIYGKLQSFLDRDCDSFTQETVVKFPEIKMSIDWIYRLISQQEYVYRLLRAAIKGEQFVSEKIVRLARGVQGPWSRLDVPMQERVFEWSEIDPEVRGRDKDIRGQRRYRMGLENYNDDQFKEGFVWREQRNEPFLWTDRDSESPYSPAPNTMRS